MASATEPAQPVPPSTDAPAEDVAPIPHASPVLAVHAFIAENEDELAFEIGERLIVVEKDEVYGDGWWRGRNAAGLEGLFPASYVQADTAGVSSKPAPSTAPPSTGPPEKAAGALQPPMPSAVAAAAPATSTAPTSSQQAQLSGLAAAAGITPTRELGEDEARSGGVAPLVPASAPAASSAAGSNTRDEQPTTPGGTVMQNTIGDIDKAISSLGPAQGGAAVGGAVALASPPRVNGKQPAAGDEADDESLDGPHGEDDADADADADLGSPIWGAAGRSRLAAQARAENSRKEAEQAERDGLVRSIQAQEADAAEAPLSGQSNGNGVGAGGVKGLVYSDESEDEEDLQAQREVEAVRKRLADEEAARQAQPQVQPAAETPESGPAAQADTTEKEASAGGIGEQALAAAAAVAVGTGAVVAAGYHSAAQAVGLEPQQDTSAGATSQAAARDVSPSSQPQADDFMPPSRAPLPDESPRGASVAPRFDAPVASPGLLPPPAIHSDGPSPKSGAPAQFAAASPAADTTRSAVTPATANGFSQTPQTADSGVNAPGEQSKTNGWASVPGEPSQWTVQQVVAWARGKGFDEGVTSKFEEHEITGDVLLELDANLLKELEIPQFGKRVKIANAIAELRRPASTRSGANGSIRSNSQPANPGTASYATSEGGPSYVSSPVTPGYPASFPASPLGAQNASSDARPVSAVAAPPLERAQSAASTTPRELSENAGLGYGPQPGDAVASNGSSTPGASGSTAAGTGPAAGYAEWAHSHIRQQSQSGSLVNAPIKEEDESGAARASAGPLVMSSIDDNRDSTVQSDSIRSKSSSMPASPSTAQTSTKRSSGPPTPLGHKKNKSSVDGGRTPSERMSFFGGAIGRNRKPAPRYPSNASTANFERDDNSSGHERSRSIKGLISGPRAGRSSTAAGDATSKNRLSAASPERSVPASPAGPKTAGGSAIAQIGTPDFAGYMKKKGERYNSWKTRYFVLKGAHLYYMKDQNEAHIKGHIDLAGYKVMTDDETSGGSHGFQIVHEREKTHHFSSNEYRVVKDWMKNIMKATITRDYSAPVVSSCNIPTIPLKEAQMMSPGPRPPSPSDIQATQRASRRENPNQLTARDASVLMSFDNSPASPKSPKSPRRSLALQQTGSRASTLQPGRPSRDMRRPSEGMAMPRHDSDASFYPQESTPAPASPRKPAAAVALAAPTSSGTDHAALLSWINARLPPGCPKATHIPESFTNGQIITRCIEHVAGPTLSAPPPQGDVIFAPTESGPSVEGLFMMMDRCIDEGVDPAGVSIHDVMTGNEREVVKLLENLRKWGEAKERA